MSVYVEYKKGEFVGREGDLWLVDTGSAIIKSKYEPVTHQFPEGWYLREGRVIHVSHYTAWVKNGKLEPIYQYTDYSHPPFGSNCLHESEVKALKPAECPYLPVDAVTERADEFAEQLRPLKRRAEELRKSIAALEQERKTALNAICQHDWQKDGDEEETGRSGFGTSFKQEWLCEACGITHTSHFTRLG